MNTQYGHPVSRSQHVEQLVEVQIRLDIETLDEFRKLNPDVKIRMQRICGWKYPCAVYLLPESEAVDLFRTMQETDTKREQRERRCLLPDGHGGFVRCNAKNKCAQCEKAGSFDFDSFLPASFSAFDQVYGQESDHSGWPEDEPSVPEEPSVGMEEIPAETFAGIGNTLVQQLTAIKPKYGAIFSELLKGNMKPLNIAKALNLGKTQVYEALPKVMALARKLYFDML